MTGSAWRGIVRRQAPFAVFLAVLCAGAAVPFCLAQRDQYLSTVTAAYDPTDAVGVPLAAPAASRFAQVVATLKARLAEPEFLWQVALAVELSLDATGDTPLADDSVTKAKVAKLLGPSFRASADVPGQTLTIVVHADDSLTAKRLADAAMEIFIQKELRFEAETYYRLHESHARFLEDVRAEKAKGAPLPPPADAVVADTEFMPRLEERVRELDLERRRLANQIDQPTLRTRLRVTVPATYDDVPVRRVRRRAAAGAVLASLLLIGGVASLRERFTPYARSGRRVTRAVGVPVIAEVTRGTLRRLPEMTRERAMALREGARHESFGASSSVAWRDFQDVDRAIARVAVGPVVYLATATGKFGTRTFLHNLLAVTALDQAVTRLVLDAAPGDPLGAKDERRRLPGDLGRFLAGKVLWKEIRVNRSLDRPYDLVFAGAVEDDARAAFTPAVLARLFTSLCKGYGRVFVRAPDPRLELESQALLKAATDCVLLVDARCRLADVARIAKRLDQAKLRGIVLLGT